MTIMNPQKMSLVGEEKRKNFTKSKYNGDRKPGSCIKKQPMEIILDRLNGPVVYGVIVFLRVPFSIGNLSLFKEKFVVHHGDTHEHTQYMYHKRSANR